jgi:hypothetical protein
LLIRQYTEKSFFETREMQEQKEIEGRDPSEIPNEDLHNSKRSYYYDDAHGYEEYDPKDGEEEDEDDEFED